MVVYSFNSLNKRHVKFRNKFETTKFEYVFFSFYRSGDKYNKILFVQQRNRQKKIVFNGSVKGLTSSTLCIWKRGPLGVFQFVARSGFYLSPVSGRH